jgi:hypothetical protein
MTREPTFVFHRRRDIELEAGFVLAGDLAVDIQKGTKLKAHDQQYIQHIVMQLTDFVQSGQMPDRDDLISGRSDRPSNKDDINLKVMKTWAQDRITIAVRVPRGAEVVS